MASAPPCKGGGSGSNPDTGSVRIFVNLVGQTVGSDVVTASSPTRLLSSCFDKAEVAPLVGPGCLGRVHRQNVSFIPLRPARSPQAPKTEHGRQSLDCQVGFHGTG